MLFIIGLFVIAFGVVLMIVRNGDSDEKGQQVALGIIMIGLGLTCFSSGAMIGIVAGLFLMLYGGWIMFSNGTKTGAKAKCSLDKSMEKQEQELAAFRKEMEEKEKQEIEAERIAAFRSQKDTTPWAVRYMTSSCPYCGHYKVRFETWDDKKMDVSFWGIASTELGKSYICDHCKKTW
ncbi:MAG: hypothetical protein MSH16_06265 [Oscillospiraceae bacterium]|nr:hypothetical protein [Oscillospiraceae bacterium]